MKRITSSFFVLFFMILSLPARTPLTIELKRVLELGKGDLMFQGVDSLSEDKAGNFYVLDRKAYKIYKFSPVGKTLLSFGSRGQGPGEFAYPGSIAVTPAGKIAVCEDMTFVHFFDSRGRFIERIRVPRGLALSYINDDLFYAWQWLEDAKEQILVDSAGKIQGTYFQVKKSQFSIAVPDETGRMMMPSLFEKEYTPTLLFQYYNGHAVIGVRNQYKIFLLDGKGGTVTEINRDVSPYPVSGKEQLEFIKRINDRPRLIAAAKKKFIAKIPDIKNHFENILVSDKYVWVIRIKDDITATDAATPIDIFNFQGELLGTAMLKKKPTFAGTGNLYVIQEEDEDWVLTRYTFRLKQ